MIAQVGERAGSEILRSMVQIRLARTIFRMEIITISSKIWELFYHRQLADEINNNFLKNVRIHTLAEPRDSSVDRAGGDVISVNWIP